MNIDRSITIAVGKSRLAKAWVPETLMWSEFIGRLQVPRRSMVTLAAYKAMSKPRQDELKDVGGFVGGPFKGNVRKAGAALGRDLISLDMDAIPAGATGDVLRRLDALGCAYVCYSTRKHEPGAPRLRIVVPTATTIPPDMYEPAARAMAFYIALEYCDPSTFEVNRLMYWPNTCYDAEYVFRYADAPFVDIPALLGTFYKDWHDCSSWPSVTGEVQPQKLATRQGDPESKRGLVGAFCRTYDIRAAMDKFIPGVYEETVVPGRFTFTGGSTAGGAILYDDGKFLFSHHATDPCGGKLVNSFDMVRYHLFADMDDDAADGTPTPRLPSFIRMTELAGQDPDVLDALSQDQLSAAEAFCGDAEPAERPPQMPQDAPAPVQVNSPAPVPAAAPPVTPLADAPSGVEAQLQQIYAAVEAAAPEGDTSWTKQLQRNPQTGQIAPTIQSCRLILSNDPRLKDRIRYNEFSARREAVVPMPWPRSAGSAWSDTDQAGLYAYMEFVYQITKRNNIDSAAELVAADHTFNDVKAYLSGLRWDGTPRLDTLFIDFLGVLDTPYARTVSRKAMVAAVARVLDPGCKYDTMPVISGPQGIGKSTMLAKLARGWFTDALRNFEGKDAAEIIQGVWLVEIGELGAMRKTDTDRVKQFLSQRSDRFRAAYARFAQECPRRCVFFGTVNEDEYLRDQTGNRRFWPLDAYKQRPVKNVFRDLDAEVDQIWAEALAFYQAGESLFLPYQLEAEAAVVQEEHRERYIHEDTIMDFLLKKIPSDWETYSMDMRAMYWADVGVSASMDKMSRNRICAREIWLECLGFKLDRLTRADVSQINGILARLPGWEKAPTTLKFGPHGVQRGYIFRGNIGG